MSGDFVERVCARCGKPGSLMAFRFQRDGAWRRDYYHPACFRLERIVAKRELGL